MWPSTSPELGVCDKKRRLRLHQPHQLRGRETGDMARRTGFDPHDGLCEQGRLDPHACSRIREPRSLNRTRARTPEPARIGGAVRRDKRDDEAPVTVECVRADRRLGERVVTFGELLETGVHTG